MDDRDKYEDIFGIPKKPENDRHFGEDPNATRKEELNTIKHRNVMWFYKWQPFVLVGGALFLILLFFVIMPLAEMFPESTMPLEYKSFWEIFREWSRAFQVTGRTAFIALTTLVVSDLLKRLIEHIRYRGSTRD